MPFQLNITSESEPFIDKTVCGYTDERIGFSLVEELSKYEQNHCQTVRRQSFCDGDDIVLLRYYGIEGYPYAMIRYGKKQVTVEILEGCESYLNRTFDLLNFIGLEQLLLRHDALILHSSFVRYNGMGILFSAPSGTGKSTQADLWEQFMHSETINGDRAGLRRTDGIWTAYGLPYAGSSKIYRNESAPVRAIVALAQGAENTIRPLTPMEAVRRLLPEFTLHHWDEDFMNHGLNLIVSLMTEVPAYLLTCRPDEDAVRLLADTLDINSIKETQK